MQFFSPNYPPPPIPNRDVIINEGLKIFEQSKNDEQWLKNWLERKQSLKQISLSIYRQKLIEHVQLLRQYENELKQSNHEILNELKFKIEQANNFLYDSNIIKHIQKQIHRRKSKRARVRRQKQMKLIDINKERIEQQLTTNDKCLNEKIEDIHSILRTIEQLQMIRQQNNNNNNNDQLIEIQNICKAKLLEYKNPHIELFNYLFNNQNQSFYQSTNADAQYLLRAHQNVNNLIKIRQQWDQYSTTHMSSLDNIIPLKWHEPQLPSDSNWNQYIFHRKE